MENLKIYRIDDRYIRYLSGIDTKVPHNKDAKRPYVGVVFSFGGYKYFVPMESPKPNHANIKSGKHILKLKKGEYGLLGFNNMIPVHKDALIDYDISKEPDTKYRNLLRNQLLICNKSKADILDRAQKTYFGVINGNVFLKNISCDFKALEKASKKYNPLRRATMSSK